MINRENEPEVEENNDGLPSPDARDYFAVSATAKLASETDPDISHDWFNMQHTELARDEQGAVIFGITRENDEYVMAFVEKSKGQQPQSVEYRVKDRSLCDVTSNYMRLGSTFLPAEQHHNLVANMIDALRSSTNQSSATRTGKLGAAFLRTLTPKYPERQPTTASKLPTEHRDGSLQTDQQQAYETITKQLTTLFTDEEIAAKTSKFCDDVSRTMNAYTSYFPYQLEELVKLAVDNNPDYPPQYDRRDIGDKVVNFNASKSVTRRPQSIAEMTEILKQEPFEHIPPYRSNGAKKAAIVEINQVTGAFNATDWASINSSENRGRERIWELAERMQRGQPDPYPIHVVKIKDKYFIGQDGRHRMAAMKALGIPRCPMLVSEAE